MDLYNEPENNNNNDYIELENLEIPIEYSHISNYITNKYMILQNKNYSFHDIQKALQITVPKNYNKKKSLCSCFLKQTIIDPNNFGIVIENKVKTLLLGPGEYQLNSNHKLDSIVNIDPKYFPKYTQSCAEDFRLANVENGYIMILQEDGKYVCLLPGIHKITDMLGYINYTKINQFQVCIGDSRWIAIPQGYFGVSKKEGIRKFLEEGKCYEFKDSSNRFLMVLTKGIITDRVCSLQNEYFDDLEKYRFDFNKLENSSKHLNKYNLNYTTKDDEQIGLDCKIQWKIVNYKKMNFYNIYDKNQPQDIEQALFIGNQEYLGRQEICCIALALIEMFIRKLSFQQMNLQSNGNQQSKILEDKIINDLSEDSTIFVNNSNILKIFQINKDKLLEEINRQAREEGCEACDILFDKVISDHNDNITQADLNY